MEPTRKPSVSEHTYENAETARCSNAHQEIAYQWNPRTQWECPLCAKREEVYEIEGELDAVREFIHQVDTQMYYAFRRPGIAPDVLRTFQQVRDKAGLLDHACERLKEAMGELVKEVRL